MLKKKKKKKKKKQAKQLWGYPCFLKSYRFSKTRKQTFSIYFRFHFHGIDRKYVNKMCFEL